MSQLRSLLVFAGVLFYITIAYVDFGSLTLPVEPLLQPTQDPNQLPFDYDVRYEVLPSMITAVAPMITRAANGTQQVSYHLRYHPYHEQKRLQGRGIFNKRGAFDGDPIQTCRQCGGSTSTFNGSISSTSTASCSLVTYHGVFDLPPATTGGQCYATDYNGILAPSPSVITGLPCCFTIPASCLRNSTANSTSSSFMASTGVFRPTSSTSMSLSRSTISSTSSRFSLTTPTSTAQGSSSSSKSASTSSRAPSMGAILNSGTTAISGTTSSKLSSSSSTSGVYVSTSTYSIIVISSTTITVQPPSTPGTSITSPASSSPGSSTTSLSLSTITVITNTAPLASSSTIPTVSASTSIAPNIISGCGQASGSGEVTGEGTVYLPLGIVVTTTGTASGYASNIKGCGTMIATTGSFTGTAIITGCGSGYGTGTLKGSGTVWPAFAGGLISFVTSGTVTGVGNFSGCGTLTGTGYFSATTGSPVLVYPSTTSALTASGSFPAANSTIQPTKTVSVYLSYCPTATDSAALVNSLLSSNTTLANPFIGLSTTNLTSPANHTSSTNNTNTNPLCQSCPNSAGICCPPTVVCNPSDGKCPQIALERGGNTLNGYLIQGVLNSTAPVAGRKKVRGLERTELPMGVGPVGKEERERVRREMEKRKGMKKHRHF